MPTRLNFIWNLITLDCIPSILVRLLHQTLGMNLYSLKFADFSSCHKKVLSPVWPFLLWWDGCAQAAAAAKMVSFPMSFVFCLRSTSLSMSMPRSRRTRQLISALHWLLSRRAVFPPPHHNHLQVQFLLFYKPYVTSLPLKFSCWL